MTTDIIIGVAGIVLGFITSYIFYRIQKRRRELCWSIDSTSLIKGYSSLFEKLQIRYGGQDIENLTVSKIAFWNNGNETFDRADIAISPYIVPRDSTNTKILDCKVITASTLGNQFKAEIMELDELIIRLSFDYLDGLQGAVIQIIHTGVSVLPLIVGGEVKGIRKIEYKSKKPDFVSRVMPRIFIYFYGLTSIVFLGIYVYNSIFRGISATADRTVWLLVVAVPLTLLMFIYDIREARGMAKIPKELSVFEKDEIGVKRRN